MQYTTYGKKMMATHGEKNAQNLDVKPSEHMT